VLENYPGNTGSGGSGPKSGYEFSQDLHQQAESFGAEFLLESVVSLKKENEIFILTLGNGETRAAPAVLLATGAKHRTLDINGEAQFTGKGVSYCAACDGPFFKGKKIFVVGGGDAACDEAQYLSRLSPHVVLVHRRSRFRAQKALAERVLHNQNIEVRFNTVIKEISGDQKVTSVLLEKTDNNGNGLGETYKEEADAVFVFAGMIPQTAIVSGAEAKLHPDLDETGYIITDQNMTSSVPGLFAAGDVRACPFRQVVVAAGEGAVAAHSVSAYLDDLKGETYR
jgi:thioredoxin reductase (NADPH)